MNLKQVKQLKRGDKVFWEDPDNGLTSRIYTIKTIRIGGVIIFIEDKTGDCLECEAHELKPLKKFAVKVYWEMSAEHEVLAANKQHAAQVAMEAPLPPSDAWEFVPDSENVDEELDVQQIRE